ncbi:MAG: hypothetical protein SOZ62_04315 [Eubacteriales bacterium]|nr:hypothetical protein [Eubacteriales bacterium]
MKIFGKKHEKMNSDNEKRNSISKKRAYYNAQKPTAGSSGIEIFMNRDGTAHTAIICGAKSFINYLPELITVNLGKNNIDIVGSELECSTFCGGCVELFGIIEEIKFK